MNRSVPPPIWTVFVLAALFAPTVVVHEPVFGGGIGLVAAGSGVAVGLAVSVASTRWRWDVWTTAIVAVASYLILGGPAALRETTISGVIPSATTIRLLVTESVASWKDLLTLSPPAAGYVGPSVMPWFAGLMCALASGLLTLRAGRYLLGSLPILVMGVVGVAWGPAATRPAAWPVAVWTVALLSWWAWCAQHGRVSAGEEILIGRHSLGGAATEHSLTASAGTLSGRRVAVVYTGRRLVALLATLALAAAVATPVASAQQGFAFRTVLRDLVQPPLDVHEYASPLAAFRHYTTDLAKTPLVTMSALPEHARVRLAVMDTYDGIAFGMADPTEDARGRYVRVGTRIADDTARVTGPEVDVNVATDGLIGPWLPVVGVPDDWRFTGAEAADKQESLYINRWADAALTTAMPADGSTTYALHAVVPPTPSDGQFEGVATGAMSNRPDTNVPEEVSVLAASVTAKEVTQLGRARAIERYLSRTGFFSSDSAADSRPGHRADRLQRMLQSKQLVGDDEQYAVLMALMLRDLGMPARVVMGLYPSQPHSATSELQLTGADVHAWVEVEFAGVGWANFDPTPPRDQVPQTDAQRPRSVPKPQVLQPPDPPLPPVQLPPSGSQRAASGNGQDNQPFPWAVVAGSGVGLLLLVVPIIAIMLAKSRRLARRRRALDPAACVAGAWDEAVDSAVDAGARVSGDLTRQETAQLLTVTAWAAADQGSAGDGVRGASTTGLPLWYVTGDSVPTAVALARHADAAAFAAQAPDAATVEAAWSQQSALRASLIAGVNPILRAVRRLSLRSIRRRRALASRAWVRSDRGPLQGLVARLWAILPQRKGRG